MRLAVVLLTRGYSKKYKYRDLIYRNKALQKYHKKNFVYLIFHEGNIPFDHQVYIQNKTPNKKITFINISEKFVKIKKNIVFYPPTKNYGLGYRNMCSFWVFGFWDYVKNYDKIIRIDEDCFINFDYGKVFEMLNNKIFISGSHVPDLKEYTHKLNDFTLKFLKENNIEKKDKKKTAGPYTNVFGLNLKKLRGNSLLFKFINEIKKSNNIYIYRWGDLAIWGEIIHYLYSQQDYLISKKICYVHKSHFCYVNM